MSVVRTFRRDGFQQAARFWLIRVGVAYLILTLVMYGLAVIPGVPYNIQELFGAQPTVLKALLFAVIALVAFSPPAFIGVQQMRMPLRWAWLFPVGIIVHGVVVFLGYRFATPIGSLHDMVGLPSGDVLPAELERWLRFMGLFALVSVPIAGGVGLFFAVTRSPLPIRFLTWVGFAVVAVLASWWIVVISSATDNITLILRGGGSLLSVLFLGVWVFVLSFSAALLAQRLSQLMGGTVITLFGILLCLPLSYWALMLALTPHIGGGDHGLSAMAFLLSPSRQEYSSGGILFWRYAVGYLTAVVVLALCQYPVWLGYATRRFAVARPAGSV
jgi:hypothetical protein